LLVSLYLFFPQKIYWVYSVGGFLIFWKIIQLENDRKNFKHQLIKQKESYILLIAKRNRNWRQVARREEWEFPKEFRDHSYSKDLDLTKKISLFSMLDFFLSKNGVQHFCDRMMSDNLDSLSIHQSRIIGISNNRAIKVSLRFLHNYFDTKIYFKTKRFSIKKFPNWIVNLSILLKISISLILVLGILFAFSFGYLLILVQLFLYFKFNKQIAIFRNQIERDIFFFEKNWYSLKKKNKISIQAHRELTKIHSKLSNIPIIKFLLQILFSNEILAYNDFYKWNLNYEDLIQNLLKIQGQWETDISLKMTYILFEECSLPQIMDMNQGELFMKSLVHPIIGSKAVPNDWTSNSDGQIAVITGSNMSGKTTYLRSVALSLLLAKMGGPIFAKSGQLAEFKLATLIRAEDNLEEGISFFYAEINRIKNILSWIGENPKYIPILLMDEILKGTNSKERNWATREILRLIKNKKGSLFVTTHDIEIANYADLTYYFQEIEAQGRIEFDYKIKAGIAKETNAIALLQKAGVPIRNFNQFESD